MTSLGMEPATFWLVAHLMIIALYISEKKGIIFFILQVNSILPPLPPALNSNGSHISKLKHEN
jgi:hypothetical protein